MDLGGKKPSGHELLVTLFVNTVMKYFNISISPDNFL